MGAVLGGVVGGVAGVIGNKMDKQARLMRLSRSGSEKSRRVFN
jgi:hypothetical protein